MTAPTVQGLLHVEAVMGTTVTLDIRDTDLTRHQLTRALTVAVDALHDTDRMFSPWRASSAISQLRRGTRRVEQCPSEVVSVIARCAAAHRRTDGWFDPWSMPGGFDPTGLVKGWAAQRALRSMAHWGVRHAMVNAGGDVAVLGSPDGRAAGPAWRIGVLDPHAPHRVLATVNGTDLGVATSGGYERGSLAIDPGSGASVHRLASATVVVADLALADAYATAATAHGPHSLTWLSAAPGVEAMLIQHDGTLLTTPGWAGVLNACSAS